MRYGKSIWLMLVFALTGCGVASVPIHTYEARQPIHASAGTKTISFRRLVTSIERNAQIGTIQAGLACIGNRKMVWTHGHQLDSSIERNYAERLGRELSEAGYRLLGVLSKDELAGAKLFDDSSTPKGDLMIAAVIRTVAINVCYPHTSFGRMPSKGEASIEVEWQLYDPGAKAVILTLTTGGSSAIQEPRDGGAAELLLEAFAAAARALLADARFASYARERSS